MARMSAAHLASQGGGYEPQRAYDFEVELYGVPGQEVIKLATANFDPPSADNEQIELPYLNEVVFVAGQGRWSTATIVIRDMVDQPVWSSIMQWKKDVQDPANGNTGFASTYKKQGGLKMIGPDGSGDREYKLKGIWPQSVKGDTADYGNNAVYQITVTLSVDKAEPLF